MSGHLKQHSLCAGHEFSIPKPERVGFKPAGGIVTVNDAVSYYRIAEYCLGKEWLNNNYFRIGASRLANNILSEIAGERNDHF